MFGKSLTVIFNVLALVIAVANGLGFVDFKPDPSIPAIAIGIVAVINLVLRLRQLPPNEEHLR